MSYRQPKNTVTGRHQRHTILKTKIIIKPIKIALISRCGSGGYQYVGGNAVATQKQYNQQKAQIEAEQAAAKRIQDAIDNDWQAAPKAYADNLKFDYVVDQPNVKMNQPIVFGRKQMSFDVNVDGLKAGDKIHIANLVVKSNDPTWDKLNDFMFLSRSIPVYIDGTQYGYVANSTKWGLNHNGGDQGSQNGQRGAGSDTHELYIVMTKDYSGVGNQHITIDTQDKNDLSMMNLEVGPDVFNGYDTVNAAVSVVDHNGKTVNSKQFTLTRPTKADFKYPWFEDESGLGLGDGQPHVFSIAKILDGNDGTNRYTDFTTSNGHINVQDNYTFTAHASRTSATVRGNDQHVGDAGRLPVDLGFTVFDSSGHPLDGFRNVQASNTDNMRIPVTWVQDNLSETQLANMLDKTKAMGLMSWQSDGSWNAAYNLSKSWIQERTEPVLSSATNIMRTYPMWHVMGVDSNPQQAIQGTINFYKANQWMPTHFGIWQEDLLPVNPNAKDRLTVTAHALNAPAGYDGEKNMEASQANPNSAVLIKGQAGIHVHYIDGSTGKPMRQIENDIDNANSSAQFTVNPLLGYTLTTKDAVGIPSGAETIEQSGPITYPGDGQWKDVYVVYMPYLTSGTATANYHYDVAKITSVLRGAASPCHCPCSRVP